MKFHVISIIELDSILVNRWRQIQEADLNLASPYFTPEFTQAVGLVRKDVFIGIMENQNRIVGFFPFQKKKGRIARPIGLGLSDYHGVIAEINTEWSAEELLRGCKLIRWEFDHLPVNQKYFNLFHKTVSDSPIIDVTNNMEYFERSRDKASRKQLQEAQRKRKKFEEKHGPLIFTSHSLEKVDLLQLIRWKSRQCQNTGTVDFFALDWCVKLIDNIHSTRGKYFGGILSSLHIGETLAAVHFGMYSRLVWHSWFPAYNHELEEYSPGFILLLELIKKASEEGIKYIDLGKGLSIYKKRVMTGSILVAEGTVNIPSLYNNIHSFINVAEQHARNSILSPILRIPGRIIKRIESKGRYK